MNHKEKIEQASWNFAPMPYNEGKDWDEVKNANLRAGFKEGYKQGYNDAINDACELLARMVWEVTYEDLDCNSTHHYDKIEFIEDFKKAMEEHIKIWRNI